MRTATRIGLFMACLAAVFPVVAPTQPASAGTRCETYPQTPYMSDYKLELVVAENVAQCELEMFWIRAEADLMLWVGPNGLSSSYRSVSHGEVLTTNTRYATAFADISCKTMGAEVRFTTFGKMTGNWNGVLDEDQAWGQAYRVFNCSPPPLRDIDPG